MELYKHKIY